MTFPQQTIFCPVNRFLIKLAEGWRFSNDVAEALQCHHGEYSCILWRPVDEATP